MPKKHRQPDGFAPGIYFNMPEDAYHNDKALSHSGITDILISEMDYWENSPLNPEREFKESDAMKFGKRCHMMLLEEKKFFDMHNVAGSGWKKDRVTITSNEFKLIKKSCDIIRSDPATSEYFKHGYPEVSIFWVDPATGIRLRIRVDYLRTFGCVDLKRLRSIQKKRLGYDIQQYGYDLQDYMYREGVAQAKIGLKKGTMQAHGEVAQSWLKAFMEDPDTLFVFFAQRSVRPFIYRIWHFDEYIREEAKQLVERGILKYKRAIETYGETGWPYGSAKAEIFSIDDMPRRNINE